MDPQRLAAIARRHDLELIVQFGSSVSGLMHPGSDVDVAVIYRQMPDSYAALGDLAADPLFLKQVMDRARLLYGSHQRFDQMKLYAFRRYQDHRPYLDMERAYVAADRRSRPRPRQGVRGTGRCTGRRAEVPGSDQPSSHVVLTGSQRRRLASITACVLTLSGPRWPSDSRPWNFQSADP